MKPILHTYNLSPLTDMLHLKFISVCIFLLNRYWRSEHGRLCTRRRQVDRLLEVLSKTSCDLPLNLRSRKSSDVASEKMDIPLQ